jgi:hypothetical protein
MSNNETGEARRFLEFAIQFTPQYGDSFIEYLRLELMEHGFTADTSKLEQACVNADPNYGTMWLHRYAIVILIKIESHSIFSKQHPLDSTRQVLRNAKTILIETSSKECGDSEECPDSAEKSQRHGQTKRGDHLYKYRDGKDSHDGVPANEVADTDGVEESEDRDSDIEGIERTELECHDPRDMDTRRRGYGKQGTKTDQTNNDLQAQPASSDEEGATLNSSIPEDQSDPVSSAISSNSSPSLTPSPPVSPFPSTASGVLMVGGYGVLSLNRVYRDSRELTSSERKKLIFGSDQIKP